MRIREKCAFWLNPTIASEGLCEEASDAAVCEQTPNPLLKAVKNEAEITGRHACGALARPRGTLFSLLGGEVLCGTGGMFQRSLRRRSWNSSTHVVFWDHCRTGGNEAMVHSAVKARAFAQVSRDEIFLLD